jgi:hypothetical protein
MHGVLRQTLTQSLAPYVSRCSQCSPVPNDPRRSSAAQQSLSWCFSTPVTAARRAPRASRNTLPRPSDTSIPPRVLPTTEKSSVPPPPFIHRIARRACARSRISGRNLDLHICICLRTSHFLRNECLTNISVRHLPVRTPQPWDIPRIRTAILRRSQIPIVPARRE